MYDFVSENIQEISPYILLSIIFYIVFVINTCKYLIELSLCIHTSTTFKI